LSVQMLREVHVVLEDPAEQHRTRLPQAGAEEAAGSEGSSGQGGQEGGVEHDGGDSWKDGPVGSAAEGLFGELLPAAEDVTLRVVVADEGGRGRDGKRIAGKQRQGMVLDGARIEVRHCRIQGGRGEYPPTRVLDATKPAMHQAASLKSLHQECHLLAARRLSQVKRGPLRRCCCNYSSYSTTAAATA
jgi:hypothetical protein